MRQEATAGESRILRDWQLTISVDHVLRGQGADPAAIRARNPAAVALAERALRQGMPLLAPVLVYRRLSVESVRHERILLPEGGSLSGPLVARHLAAAEQVAVMAATIGRKLEERISEVIVGDPPYALALDGVGSAAMAALAEAACHYFSEVAARAGLHTTIPLSPGIEGWPLGPGQGEIFALLDTTPAGLRLTSESLMVPRQSLSMVIGLGREVMQGQSACDYCNLRETCRYRNLYRASGPAGNSNT